MGCGFGPQASLRDWRPFGVQPGIEIETLLAIVDCLFGTARASRPCALEFGYFGLASWDIATAPANLGSKMSLVTSAATKSGVCQPPLTQSERNLTEPVESPDGKIFRPRR